jgi:hypothetical protein
MRKLVAVPYLVWMSAFLGAGTADRRPQPPHTTKLDDRLQEPIPVEEGE